MCFFQSWIWKENWSVARINMTMKTLEVISKDMTIRKIFKHFFHLNSVIYTRTFFFISLVCDFFAKKLWPEIFHLFWEKRFHCSFSRGYHTLQLLKREGGEKWKKNLLVFCQESPVKPPARRKKAKRISKFFFLIFPPCMKSQGLFSLSWSGTNWNPSVKINHGFVSYYFLSSVTIGELFQRVFIT